MASDSDLCLISINKIEIIFLGLKSRNHISSLGFMALFYISAFAAFRSNKYFCY